MNQLEKQWNLCKHTLSQQIGAEDSSAWLNSIRLEELRPDRVVFSGIPNSFFRNRIKNRFRSLLMASLNETFPELSLEKEAELELRLGFPEPGDSPASTPASTHETSQRDTVPSSRSSDPLRSGGASPGDPTTGVLPNRYEFSNFIRCSGNQDALAFVQQITEAPGSRFNPLLLVAGSGLGKTHLLQTATAHLGRNHAEWRVLYRTGERFKTEVLEAITRRRMDQFQKLYRHADALILDNLEFLLVSPRAQEELLHTLDQYLDRGRQLILSADRMPGEMKGLSDGLRTRLEKSLIAELLPLDETARLAFLRQKAHDEGLHLPDDVAHYMAERISGNPRRLEGAVVRLSAHANLHGHEINLGYAEALIAPFVDHTPGSPTAHPDKILVLAAKRFGVTASAIKGRSRTPNVVGARRVVIHLLKQLSRLSYPEIGAFLGNRSHSTIINGHQTLLQTLKSDSGLQNVLHDMMTALGIETPTTNSGDRASTLWN